ncbi:MAG TPA: hypothetical protein VNG90_01445 [Candidatus Acidoferrum sp.]|nr:hypothetical protein [Candidatus Acidoferrum sp.]
MSIESIPSVLGYVQSPRLRALARRSVGSLRCKYGSRKSRATIGYYQSVAEEHIHSLELEGLAFDRASAGLDLQLAIMFRNAGCRQDYIERLVNLTELPNVILPDFARAAIRREISRR